jgi:riboflavin kinase/FMN adenylyltransferase
MEVVTELSDQPPLTSGSAVTIGAYDGVHLGHRTVLADLRRRAADAGLATVVVTFDRHPASVLRPEQAPKLLCDLDQKLELLAEAGVDRTVVVHFDEARASETAEAFVLGTLVDALAARLVVVGEDFHFGHGRKGNVELLADMGRTYGFTVDGVHLARDTPSGPPISSTRIRGLVADGAVEEAARLLGRPHRVRGVVGAGDGRGGSELGFPTSNLTVAAELALPGLGIYACWYERPSGERHRAAVSVGRRPTFYGGDGALLVEAHLLDFSGNLYGEHARLSFVRRLRDELAFSSVDDLVAQMHRDVAGARAALDDAPASPAAPLAGPRS